MYCMWIVHSLYFLHVLTFNLTRQISWLVYIVIFCWCIWSFGIISHQNLVFPSWLDTAWSFWFWHTEKSKFSNHVTNKSSPEYHKLTLAWRIRCSSLILLLSVVCFYKVTNITPHESLTWDLKKEMYPKLWN